MITKYQSGDIRKFLRHYKREVLEELENSISVSTADDLAVSTNRALCRKLFRAFDSDLIDELEEQDCFKALDWSKVETYILDWFGGHVQPTITMLDVDAFVEADHKDQHQYLREFNRVWLQLPTECQTKAYDLDKSLKFIRGLKPSLRDTVAKRFKKGKSFCPPDFESVFAEARSCLDELQMLEGLSVAVKGSGAKPSHDETVPLKLNNTLESSMQKITKGLEQLTIRLAKLEGGVPRDSDRKTRHCVWCDSTDHLKKECQDLAIHLDNGSVHFNQRGYLCNREGLEIPFNYGHGGMKAKVGGKSEINVRHVQLIPKDDQDEWVGYTYSDDEDVVDLVEIFDAKMAKRAAEAGGNRAHGKRTRFADLENPKADDEPMEMAVDPLSKSDEEEVVDTRGPMFKRGTFIGATPDVEQRVYDQLMDTVVPIRQRDLLALSSGLQRNMAESVKTRRIPIHGPRPPLKAQQTLKVDEYHDDPATLGVMESAQTGRIRGKLYDLDVMFELDPGSEVCLMPLRVVNKLRLSVGETDVAMGTASTYVERLVGKCSGVPITVGGVTVPMTVYVLKEARYDVLLGKNWEVAVRARSEIDSDGRTRYQIRSADGSRVESFIAAQPEPSSSRRPRLVQTVQLMKLGHVADKEELVCEVQAAYKSVAKKVKPVAVAAPNAEARFKWTKEAKPEPIEAKLEKIARIPIGDGNLLDSEVEYLRQILLDNADAFAFSLSDRGQLKEEIMGPYQIRTVDHLPWNDKPFPVPPRMKQEVVDFLKDRIENGVLEPSQAPYSNKWFVIRKTNGSLRLISDFQRLNAVTIRDVGIPPRVDEHSEAFAGFPFVSVFDLISAYDQLTLAYSSRDMTTIITPLGPVRFTTLPQGFTNSVAVCQSAVCKVYAEFIPKNVQSFLDDLGLRPDSRVLNEEMLPAQIRQGIKDYGDLLDRLLQTTIAAGLTFSGDKTKIAVREVEVMGCLCTPEGRYPTEDKVAAINRWSKCSNVTEVRSFLGMVGYFRCWIKDFSSIAAPMYYLTKKGVKFQWGSKAQKAMDTLKTCISAKPVLCSADYSSDPVFIVSSDAGPNGGGGVLYQLQPNGRRGVLRYASFVFNDTQKGYAQIKKELYALARVLKVFRVYIYGYRVQVEVDCLPLIGMINKPDVICPTLTRWITYIRLFDCEFSHISGKANVVADALSRLPGGEPDLEAEHEFDADLDKVVGRVCVAELAANCKDLLQVHQYLLTLSRPTDITDQAFNRLCKQARHFLVQDTRLFRRSKKPSGVPRAVVFDGAKQLELLTAAHASESGGHRGVQNTLSKLAYRYFWPQMSKHVQDFVRSCAECQKRGTKRDWEPLHPTLILSLHRRWSVDIVHMPTGNGGYKYIIDAREDLTGWVEARMLKSKTTVSWIQFFHAEVLCRHGVVGEIYTDNGELATPAGRAFCEQYGIKLRVTTPYHPQANGKVERGHSVLSNVLSKMSGSDKKSWPKYFYGALWADRITAHSRSGETPYYLMFGQEAVLPLEVVWESWASIAWKYPATRQELMMGRTQQLTWKMARLDKAAKAVAASRDKDRIRHETLHNVRDKPLEAGAFVLLYNSALREKKSGKLEDRWLGPYRVVESLPSRTYRIAELDGTVLKRPVHGDRLKLFMFPIAQGTSNVLGPADVEAEHARQ